MLWDYYSLSLPTIILLPYYCCIIKIRLLLSLLFCAATAAEVSTLWQNRKAYVIIIITVTTNTTTAVLLLPLPMPYQWFLISHCWIDKSSQNHSVTPEKSHLIDEQFIVLKWWCIFSFIYLVVFILLLCGRLHWLLASCLIYWWAEYVIWFCCSSFGCVLLARSYFPWNSRNMCSLSLFYCTWKMLK